MRSFGHAFSILGVLLVGWVCAMGTYWALTRGANDFSVFHSAWSVAIEGRGIGLYTSGPDRFLYAPGFGWLFSPLGLLPRTEALVIWCFLKTAAVAWAIRSIASLVPLPPLQAWGVGSWSMLLVARPLLIDFQYGQVNLFMLATCIGALAVFVNPLAPSGSRFVTWFLLTVFSVAKLFSLPLLLLPWITGKVFVHDRGRWIERSAIVAGIVFMFGLPLIAVGWDGNLQLLEEWKQALLNRGLPLESHNQSLAGFLSRYFSGDPTHVIALGSQHVLLGAPLLSPDTIRLLSLAWISASAGFILAWMWLIRAAPLRWSGVLIAALILPSHLIWKPYFIFTFPIGAILIWDAVRPTGEKGKVIRIVGFVVAICLMNFTSFDFIGRYWSARLEAASVLLWVHVVLLVIAVASHSTRDSFVSRGPASFFPDGPSH